METLGGWTIQRRKLSCTRQKSAARKYDPVDDGPTYCFKCEDWWYVCVKDDGRGNHDPVDDGPLIVLSGRIGGTCV